MYSIICPTRIRRPPPHTQYDVYTVCSNIRNGTMKTIRVSKVMKASFIGDEYKLFNYMNLSPLSVIPRRLWMNGKGNRN